MMGIGLKMDMDFVFPIDGGSLLLQSRQRLLKVVDPNSNVIKEVGIPGIPIQVNKQDAGWGKLYEQDIMWVKSIVDIISAISDEKWDFDVDINRGKLEATFTFKLKR